ncbi:TadE/TadG family type IV pilus assembly protein [Streptomyces wuyuanensis]|uniref:Pilus assembly protein CpaE n=1 Tax=Streptomyces wuyuanensis TaxID=1196353 RepID=A0A1G9NZ58_9ACTN|nr:TadE/TadG family type IV pilus assembly protein [Streptomyces wuyuanensis]SDL91699.1 pilus assembly protein CpaE [Streptomyces wuyuanensis]
MHSVAGTDWRVTDGRGADGRGDGVRAAGTRVTGRRHTAGGGAGSRRTFFGEDRGQTAVEFTGMVPIILATLILLWQAALVGYSFSLAGNSADEGARAGAAAGWGAAVQVCEQAARKNLPDSWEAEISCPPGGGDLYDVEVDVVVPVLYPGFIDFSFTAPGRASAVWEG